MFENCENVQTAGFFHLDGAVFSCHMSGREVSGNGGQDFTGLDGGYSQSGGVVRPLRLNIPAFMASDTERLRRATSVPDTSGFLNCRLEKFLPLPKKRDLHSMAELYSRDRPLDRITSSKNLCIIKNTTELERGSAMNREPWNKKSLLEALENVLGRTSNIEQEGPGIYYLSADGNEAWSGGEYYAVCGDAPDISKEAKEYGLRAETCPGLLLYPFAKDNSGWRIIQYEVYRYRTENKIPLPEAGAFTNAALYGCEIHPEYFGLYPAPALTPWGRTLRHKALDNGIYWIETNQCKHVLAVCFPIWQELSSTVAKIGKPIKAHSALKAGDPLFFEKLSYCLPIWELLKARPKWESGLVDRAALMNHIWKNFPQYAAAYNTQVQQGMQDTAGLLLNAGNIQVALNPNIKDGILLSPQVGCDFLYL